jgi:hypothetical protein
MNDAEIHDLVRKLEQCEIAPTEFHHRDHLAVSVAYLYALDSAPALDRMRATLKRFIGHHGLKGYHETVTRFWMEQVADGLNRRLCLCESVRLVQEQLGDKDLVYRYYTRDTLNSAEAKERWVEPDRKDK